MKNKCSHLGNHTFAVFPLTLLAIGILWLLSDLNVLAWNVPWLPITLIVLVIGAVLHHHVICK